MSKKSLWQFTRASILAFLITIFISFSTVAYSQLNTQNKCRMLNRNGANISVREEPQVFNAPTVVVSLPNGNPLNIITRRTDNNGKSWLRVSGNFQFKGWIQEDQTSGCK